MAFKPPPVKESYLWSQLKMAISDDETHLCRIENTAGTGIADVNACYRGVEVWLELKVVHGNFVSFRTSQRGWMLTRHRAGGRVLVFVRNGDELALYMATDMLAAEHRPAPDGKSFTVHVNDLPTPMFRCKKPFSWHDVKENIFHGPPF